MSYHIIDISSEGATLSVKNGQLVCCLKDGGVRTLPLEDIGAIVVNSFSVSLHNSFLSAAADARIAVVICERFKPKSIVLPVQRGGDTLLSRAQICASNRLLDALWAKTVDAKVANQFDLMTFLSPAHPALTDFRAAMAREDVFKEGNCARLYWDVFSGALGQKGFRRQHDDDGLNALLNYAYGVLLTRVLQRLLAFGLDPMYGVGHVVRERAAPLAYDVMEPFRPAFDKAVHDWVMQRDGESVSLDVSTEFKRMAQGVWKMKHPHLKLKAVSLENILDLVLKSLRQAFLTGKVTEYRPWTRRSSAWAG